MPSCDAVAGSIPQGGPGVFGFVSALESRYRWKWFNATKGCGFIQPEGGGPDVFVYVSAVERAGHRSLAEGARVSYELVTGRNGKTSAENLRLS